MDNSPIVEDRRGGPRQTLKTPVYVNLGPSASGFLCDLSEGGLAIDVFGRLECNQVVQLAFDLPETNFRIEAIAQISWTNQLARRAGLKFVDMSERLVQQIGDWISVQYASRAQAATQSGAEETARSETSSMQSETERQGLWSDEYLAELRTALSQPKRLPVPKRSRQIINWLRTPIDSESARRAGLQFVDISKGLAQRIGDWISLQNISRADVATPAKAGETVESEASSTQSETERQGLWSDEPLAELRTALSQARTLPKPKRSEQIIRWLKTPVSNQLMEFCLSLVLIVGTLLVVAYNFTQQRLQVHTAQATNGEPVRPSEHSAASVTAKPAASSSPLLNPSVIPPGAILLQVAALTRERDALALAEALEQKKYPAFVRRSDPDDYYHVQVGPYVDAASARSATRRLEKDGFKPIVKR